MAGSFPLGALLRTEGAQAWFATRYQQRVATAFIAKGAKGWGSNIRGSKEETQIMANLEAASQVQHPNLVRIERVGRTRMDGMPVAYAIQEPTEENLAEVLRERALTLDETVQITESLIAALSALRAHGLLHGSVTTANVFAVGESVKLRSDCIHKAPVGAKDDPDGFAQDLGDLGALIFEALTQRRLTAPDDPAIDQLPTPFRAIVQSAVTGRWGLTDISAALKKPLLAARHPVPTGARMATGKFAKAARPKIASGRVRSPLAVRLRSVRRIAIIAILAALAGLWYLYRGASDAPAADAPTHVAGEPSH